MKTKTLVGIIAGGTSIAFSSLCVFFTPVFSLAFLPAAIVGAIGGSIAIALQARRTALVAFTFALTPLLFFLFLLIEFDGGIGESLVALIPIGGAFAVAVWALADYSREKRVGPRVV